MKGCGVKAGQNLPFSNPTPICRMLLCACMMGSAGGAATFDSYHVAGRLGAGGANLQIANQFNSADSTEDHLWSIGGGGAGGGYTSSKPLPPPVDAPGDARYGDIAVDGIDIQYWLNAVIPNGVMDSSGSVAIPPAGNVGPGTLFRFHHETRMTIADPVSNRNPSTMMWDSGWWNFSGISAAAPLYYAVEYRFLADVSLPGGQTYRAVADIQFPGPGIRQANLGPVLEPFLGHWWNPQGTAYVMGETLPTGSYEVHGTSHGQVDVGEFGWKLYMLAAGYYAGTVNLVADMRIAFSDTPITGLPPAGGRFSGFAYSASTGFSCTFSDGTSGQPYRIQVSSSPVFDSWSDITNFIYAGAVTIKDPSPTPAQPRFYRAVSP